MIHHFQYFGNILRHLKDGSYFTVVMSQKFHFHISNYSRDEILEKAKDLALNDGYVSKF